jgi:hypothetical protein
MKLKTETGEKIDIHIDRQEFSTTWVRIGGCLVGFSARQLADVELVLSRIEVISHIAFEVPVDSEDWWIRTLDVVSQQVIKLRKKRTKIRTPEPNGDNLEEPETAA